MNRTQVVQSVLWLEQLAEVATAEAAKLREDLIAEARAEYAEQGTANQWRVPDVATVSTSVTRAKVQVQDERKLLQWAKLRHPEAVETVEVLDPRWTTALLGEVEVVDGVVCAGDGEVVPGLGYRPGGRVSGISIRASTAAKEVFATLASQGLRRLALEAGPAVPVVLADATDERPLALPGVDG